MSSILNKKITKIVILVLFLAGMAYQLPVKKAFAADYIIDSWTDLDNVRNDLSGNYTLTRSLITTDNDYVGIGDNFQPIGSGENAFTGQFNGNGFEIQGLTINGDGLFAKLSGATITKLGIRDIDINNSQEGGAFARDAEDTAINQSFVTGSIISSGYCLGSFLGMSSAGVTISDSYADININNPEGSDVGGFIGCPMDSVIIERSYVVGSLASGVYIGGIANLYGSGSVIDSFFGGTIDGTGNIGGISGSSTAITLTNSYWYNPGNVSECYFESGEVVAGCSAIADQSYFKGNALSEPMASWDFSNSDDNEAIWSVVEGGYPILAWQLDTVGSDKTAPTFENLPGLSAPINITEGQTIKTNPFIIKVKPTDADSGIARTEFSIDGIKICTESSADSDGVFSCSWDTSKYHSLVQVVAYDNEGNTATLTRNAVVDPALYLTVLPKTGKH